MHLSPPRVLMKLKLVCFCFSYFKIKLHRKDRRFSNRNNRAKRRRLEAVGSGLHHLWVSQQHTGSGPDTHLGKFLNPLNGRHPLS